MIHVIGLEMDDTWNSMKMLIPIGIAYPFIFGFESAMVLMWKLARKGFGKVKGKSRIGYRRVLLIVSYVMLPVSQVLLIVGVSAAGETGDSWWYQEEMVFCVVGMLLSGLAFWIAVIQQFRQWRVQQRLAEEKIVYELQQRSNEVIEEQKSQMDTLRGEFRKELLRVLEQVRTDPETAKKEMESFRERLNRTRTVVYCVNDTVNAVVSKYARICEERGIRFEVRLEVDGLDGIRPIDLCSVFSNLLDNAVHACEKLQEQERWIRVLAGMKGDYVRVLITNSAEAEEDKNLDGHYGQKIVREIAREYQGDFETGYHDGEYSASVILLKTV